MSLSISGQFRHRNIPRHTQNCFVLGLIVPDNHFQIVLADAEDQIQRRILVNEAP